jgi:hypothetical protein
VRYSCEYCYILALLYTGVVRDLIFPKEPEESVLQCQPCTTISITDIKSQCHVVEKMGVLVDLLNSKGQGKNKLVVLEIKVSLHSGHKKF